MVRVGSLTDYMTYAPDYLDNKTGMTAEDQLDAIFQACAPLYEERDRAYADVMHQLKKNGLTALTMEELNRDEQKYFNWMGFTRREYSTSTKLMMLNFMPWGILLSLAFLFFK